MTIDSPTTAPPVGRTPTPLSVAVVASLLVALVLVVGEQILLGFAPVAGSGASFLLVHLGIYATLSLGYGLAVAAFLGGLRRTIPLGERWRALVARVRADAAADVHVTASVLAIALAVGLVVLGFLLVYAGKDPDFLAKPRSAGPFFAFFVLVLIVVAAAAFFPLHHVCATALRFVRADRWFRSERLPLVLRVVALGGALVVLAAGALLVKLLGNYEMAIVLRLPLFLLVFVLLHAAAMLAVWRLRRALRPALGRAGVAAAALVTVALAALPLFGLGAFPAARDRIEADTVYLARVTGLLRGLLDLDRDGYAWVLDGGDCDDFAKAVNPDAEEVPGDGIDNDCRNGDGVAVAAREFALDPSLLGDGAAAAAPAAARAATPAPTTAGDAPAHAAAEPAPAQVAGAASAAAAATEGGAAALPDGGAAASDPVAPAGGVDRDLLPDRGVDRDLLKDKHLIVILFDTVRADHVHHCGYGRETTPNVDAFARESVAFCRAYAQANHTPRSMPSIFTGLFPSEIAWQKMFMNFSPIKEKNVTIFELLKEQGFTTVGVFSHDYFRPERKLQQGFDIWDNKGAKSLAEGNTESPAPDVTKKALGHFRKLAGEGQRVAAFVHYMDPHSRYMVHPKMKVFNGNETLLDKYDGEIYWTDHYIGELFDGMKELGMYENSVIVVMSDHGEAFKDHKSYFHGMTLYREEIEVPLFLRIPGVAGRDVAERVALVDLFPTVLDLFRIPYDGHHQGVSLVQTGIDGQPRGRPIYSELLKYPSWPEDIRALYVGDLKIIWNKTKNFWELYDLAGDPLEQRNVFREHPKARAMQQALLDWMDTQLKPVR
jgi:arylsulfatase A-like enzyme